MSVLSILLGLHNLVRWVVIVLAIVALVRAYRGWLGKRDWMENDRKVGVFFGMAVDIQFLLGLILILLVGIQNLGSFGVDHVIPMIVAVVLIHVGTAMARRASEPVKKHRSAALWFSLAVIIILVAIPWSRPLFPGLG
jgi:hypothetical protein